MGGPSHDRGRLAPARGRRRGGGAGRGYLAANSLRGNAFRAGRRIRSRRSILTDPSCTRPGWSRSGFFPEVRPFSNANREAVKPAIPSSGSSFRGRIPGLKQPLFPSGESVYGFGHG